MEFVNRLTAPGQENYCDPADDRPFIFRIDNLDDENDSLYIMLIVVGAVATYWRQNTSRLLDVSRVSLTTVEGNHNTSTEIVFEWDNLLRNMRQWVKNNYRTPPPENYMKNAEQIMNPILYREMVNLASFNTLVESGLLQAKHRNTGYTFQSTKRRYLNAGPAQSKGAEKSIQTALNHMRFVLFIEWRFAYELVMKNTG